MKSKSPLQRLHVLKPAVNLLHSSTEQWGMHFLKNNVAVHWRLVTADLYEQQISIGVIALTQICCESVMHSSTEQWGLNFAKNTVARHWYWVTAHLYEEQISTGVIVPTQF